MSIHQNNPSVQIQSDSDCQLHLRCQVGNRNQIRFHRSIKRLSDIASRFFISRREFGARNSLGDRETTSPKTPLNSQRQRQVISRRVASIRFRAFRSQSRLPWPIHGDKTMKQTRPWTLVRVLIRKARIRLRRSTIVRRTRQRLTALIGCGVCVTDAIVALFTHMASTQIGIVDVMRIAVSVYVLYRSATSRKLCHAFKCRARLLRRITLKLRRTLAHRLRRVADRLEGTT